MPMEEKEAILKRRDEAKKESRSVREPGKDSAEQAEGRRTPRPESPPDRAWRNHGGRVSLHRQHGGRIAQGVSD